MALIGIGTLAVLAVVWLLLVAPERDQASKLGAQVSQANAQLAAAESEAASARGAQARYSAAYASVVNLGKAVPPNEEVPALIYQLAQASNQKHVEFNSITTGAGSSAGAASSASATPAAAAAGFTQMPFTFVFNGSFSDLYHLFQQLNGATVQTASGGLQVSGRLLTLQGVKLEPKGGSEASSGLLTGTITATAYVLPSGSGLTGGATSAAPAASGAATSASTASSTSSKSSSGASGAPAAVVTAGAPR
ncbi:MAG TPA: hypothetical protein VGX69_10835 [Solirubrobacteraceae bacterium]|jgi:Tfp pilus assembly protein PilO|nr:hypothetical protein [Solirubrobacteraceae bacterium]